MIISLKNKHTLVVQKHKFRCSIGEKGLTKNKVEGDKKTPIGLFKLGNVYYREDKIKLPKVKIRSVKIKPKMGWCDDVNFPKKYNKLMKINQNIHHEKLYRKDKKYDILIPIKYNSKKIILGKGSCIFIHLTSNYKSTAGCIALKKKDFLTMLKLLTKGSKIKIN